MLLERNQGYCVLLSFVQGRRFLRPSDEDLSLHPSEQKSLAGDPESPGPRFATPSTKTCRRGPQSDGRVDLNAAVLGYTFPGSGIAIIVAGAGGDQPP